MLRNEQVVFGYIPYINLIDFPPSFFVAVHPDSHNFLVCIGKVQYGMGIMHSTVDGIFSDVRIIRLALLVVIVNLSTSCGFYQVALSSLDLNHHGDSLTVFGCEKTFEVWVVLSCSSLLARCLFQRRGNLCINSFRLGVILLTLKLILAPVLNLFLYAFAFLCHISFCYFRLLMYYVYSIRKHTIYLCYIYLYNQF